MLSRRQTHIAVIAVVMTIALFFIEQSYDDTPHPHLPPSATLSSEGPQEISSSPPSVHTQPAPASVGDHSSVAGESDLLHPPPNNKVGGRGGDCVVTPPSSMTGSWNDNITEWTDRSLIQEPFHTLRSIVDAIRKQQTQQQQNTSAFSTSSSSSSTQTRVLLVGDSITRYLMCFLSKAIVREGLILPSEVLGDEGSSTMEGCEPEQTRGVHFQFWPPTAAGRRRSPIILQFVSDFYFPESHFSQNLFLIEEEEAAWLPPASLVIISRGTWDVWIRAPRKQAGPFLTDGLTAGLLLYRKLFPDAELFLYGLANQQPARFHRYSERCSMLASFPYIRQLVYDCARRANHEIQSWGKRTSSRNNGGEAEGALGWKPIRYIDFYTITLQDTEWLHHTMKSDGMHYVGPHVKWFAAYTARLWGATLGLNSPTSRLLVEAHTPDAVACPKSTLPYFWPAPRAKGPQKKKKECSAFIAHRENTLDFEKSFHRFDINQSIAVRYSDCVFYHKASAQRLGGVDKNWPSLFWEEDVVAAAAAATSTDEESSGSRFAAWRRHLLEAHRAMGTVVTPLWDKWQLNSTQCRGVERSAGKGSIAEMMHIIATDPHEIPCGHLIVWTLRASAAKRREVGVPSLLDQRCDMRRNATL